MKRKIARIGSSTLMISLPSRWVKANHIEKGEELDVEETGSSLYIHSTPKKKTKSAEISIPTTHSFSRRILVSPFKEGHDIITIHFEEQKVLDLIQQNLYLLMGFEIVEQGRNYCTLKNVMTIDPDTVDTIFNRAIHIFSTMEVELLDAVEKEDWENIGSIIRREDLLNKYDLFCKRLLRMNIYKDPLKMIQMSWVLALVEEMGDCYVEICKHVIKEKKAISIDLKKVMKEISLQFKRSYSLFHKPDKKLFYEFREMELRIQKEINSLYHESPRHEFPIISQLVVILNKQHHITEEIL